MVLEGGRALVHGLGRYVLEGCSEIDHAVVHPLGHDLVAVPVPQHSLGWLGVAQLVLLLVPWRLLYEGFFVRSLFLRISCIDAESSSVQRCVRFHILL